MPDLLSTDQRTSLINEAIRLYPQASIRLRERFELSELGRPLSPECSLFALSDAALGYVHNSVDVISRLEQLTELAVEPSGRTYLYYRKGDFSALHKDRPRLTVLVWLAGPAGPLKVHPGLQNLAADDLLATGRACNGHPPGGTEIDLRAGPLVLAGHDIPHDRPPHPYEEMLVIAALCFDFGTTPTGGISG